MRIALIYPPPWKIPLRGESAAQFGADGPPAEFREGDLDADFFQTPYGLFSLGAQALRAGHQVKVLNLSAFAWAEVEEVIRRLDADLYGMSCWTANRRGVALVASALKQHHPGRPSWSAVRTRRRCPARCCCITRRSTWSARARAISPSWRSSSASSAVSRPRASRARCTARAAEILVGPARDSVRDLDSLASPHATSTPTS